MSTLSLDGWEQCTDPACPKCKGSGEYPTGGGYTRAWVPCLKRRAGVVPPGASQTFVYDPAARGELIASARLAAAHSTAVQWIHEHPHGEPCTSDCGPLEQPARPAGIPFG
jgi:hypothetical protein